MEVLHVAWDFGSCDPKRELLMLAIPQISFLVTFLLPIPNPLLREFSMLINYNKSQGGCTINYYLPYFSLSLSLL